MMTRCLLLAIVICGQSACFLPYITQQAYYQAKLLRGAIPIEKALSSKQMTPLQRERLELIMAVRQFAQEKLGFSTSQNYTTINLKWDHVMYNVSACEELHFKPYTWWFPVVGSVPYKGFFVKSDAEAQLQELQKLGLDTEMRQVAGYSTLGWFNDPVWPEMLQRPVPQLVDLIIHELAHATIYFKHRTDFNESFANAVARLGTLEFLRFHFGRDSDEVKSALKSYVAEDRYREWMWRLYDKLEAVYQSDETEEEKRQRKKGIFEEAKLVYPVDMNNADLMGFVRYQSNQPLFERLLVNVDRNWPRFLSELRDLNSSHDPLSSLQQLLNPPGVDDAIR